MLVQAADSSGVKALFTDFKPGAEKGLCGKFLNSEADGVRGTSKASVANRSAAQAAIREEFGLSVVVKGGHGSRSILDTRRLVTCAFLPLKATTVRIDRLACEEAALAGKPRRASSRRNVSNGQQVPASGKILAKSACQPSQKLRVASFVVSKRRRAWAAITGRA